MQFQTEALHAGYTKDTQRTMSVPIYMSTAFDFGSADFAASSFNLQQGTDNVYTRVGNPTTGVLEKRFAALEGGSGALAVGSGMSAIFYSILNVAQAGDNIVVANQLYGGTVTLFSQTLKRLGIEARYFDIHSLDTVETLIDEHTKCIFFESITNPSIDVPDFDALIAIANKHSIVTIVDNTVATPVLCQPLLLGVDVAVHSASKYTTGQGLAIGGLIVERKNLADKIKGNPRYPDFNTPEVSYHGLVFADSVVSGILFTFRARMVLMRDTGAVLSPFNAWLFIQGVETLFLRMKQHSQSALSIAQWLEKHPKVKKVNYPLLSSDKSYKNAEKYLTKGASGLLSFEVDDFETAKKVLDSVEIFSIVANIGDSKSIINHSASTTHQQLSKEELKKAGVSEGLIRLSIGLEDCDDLIADLKAALDA
ncbi:MAG: O-acetylhomoserine aminocarboxypropyltransferase/cysteine synthase family protein [Sulfuricurvum sp.]|uniref:O-acetylhomoserine aminocarboxypropyltransferase/cysteine synthase family protein n=1 Tax=Sulfuricurvum sp. TaxID=2025608 RepID=UPI0026043BEF|nr:O-acetylhomoserine aminocarboxypropyltransferase/cysteine synthase family protein [Sulfuricurvum sp.]MDD3596523.1 O-acetylhomoserine aminocarboxypropyltransferase/cysteine synthase [Sulfuricurvum sp.]MDD4883244.1 O-acetylhomoserine aminocarboxypropyltransferase/cysteine synthase [Sulfuricurvum sp.]